MSPTTNRSRTVPRLPLAPPHHPLSLPPIRLPRPHKSHQRAFQFLVIRRGTLHWRLTPDASGDVTSGRRDSHSACVLGARGFPPVYIKTEKEQRRARLVPRPRHKRGRSHSEIVAPDGKFVIYLWSVPERDGDLASHLGKMGVECIMVDTALGGRALDLTTDQVADQLCALAAKPNCVDVMASFPCSTWSAARFEPGTGRPASRTRRGQSKWHPRRRGTHRKRGAQGKQTGQQRHPRPHRSFRPRR